MFTSAMYGNVMVRLVQCIAVVGFVGLLPLVMKGKGPLPLISAAPICTSDTSFPYKCPLPVAAVHNRAINMEYARGAHCAATQLHLYDVFQDGRCKHTEEVSSFVDVTLRSAKAWLALLSSGAFLQSDENGCFSTTQETQVYSLTSSPFFVPCKTVLSASMLQVFKSGGVSVGKMRILSNVSVANVESFERGMSSLTLSDAAPMGRMPIFSDITHLVDVGAGPAVLAIGIATNNPSIQITLLETEPVCEIARRNVAHAKVQSQVMCTSRSMFDTLPSGFDAVHFGNIFHDYNDDDCIHLARNAYQSLPIGGNILLHELLFNPSMDGPLAASVLNYKMLRNEEGDQRTFVEFESLLSLVGFRNIKAELLPSGYSLIAAQKA